MIGKKEKDEYSRYLIRFIFLEEKIITLIGVRRSIYGIHHSFIIRDHRFAAFGNYVLEMFAPAEKQAKTFAMPMKFVIQKNAQIALKNMGIYNGSLGLALLTSLLLFQGDIRLKVLLLLNLFVVIVGLYGGKTVTKSIYLIQALPAIITVLFILFQLI